MTTILLWTAIGCAFGSGFILGTLARDKYERFCNQMDRDLGGA